MLSDGTSEQAFSQTLTLTLTRTGVSNAVRCKLSKHYLTLVLCTTVSVAAVCLKIAEMTCGIILELPLGLIFARIMTDKMFRYCT